MKSSLIRRKNYLRNLIHDENTRNLCRLPNEKYKNTFSRNRKITFSDILLMCLNKQGKNTSFEIRDYELNKKGVNKVSYTDEAYLKQRRILNPTVFKTMNKGYLKDFYAEQKYVIKYKGYIVLGIDGSVEEIPNTISNREHFGCSINASESKVARALLSGIYDVNNHFFIDTQINRVDSSEIELAKENIVESLEILQNNNALLVMDRGYPSIAFFEWLKDKNVNFLMRLSPNDYIKERQSMETEDEEVFLEYTYPRMQGLRKKHPATYETLKHKKGISLRIVNIQLENGIIETLITNISSKNFSIQDFKEIYNSRWKIERAYDSIKNKLKIEKFTGNLPIFVYQDIYAQMLVYNQIQDMLYTGNNVLKEKNATKNLKLEYSINENKAIGLYKEKLIEILLIQDRDLATREFDVLIEEMTRYTSAIRKGRKNNPRKWNNSNKNSVNMKPSF